ncbi:methyltransferase domain-containing protein [Synechococcus sp. CBW1002]|uniref:class I SAM-dependent methyltransferase n=1 Tax=Synechococcus sp. CBW1002 TaxID=1353134 RepID=UPI0018CDBB1F|nr:methyltransferase domain-containing protein [Synechococcus sp. CBW1002]QPN59116.1 methyltransferase domain-containing protein [Synechococcus sp. CBW1002]
MFGITKLLECQDCYLRYRFPVDSDVSNYKFYQNSYVQAGLTTDLPEKDKLSKLIRSNFLNTEKDFSTYIPILQFASSQLKRKLSLLDYGANWGYACYQFEQLPFVQAVCAYELSLPRRAYGEKELNIQYVDSSSEITEGIDVLFSSHVMEHMSNPSKLKEFADVVLKPDGIIILACPNGSNSARYKNLSWSKLWGEVHPNFISDHFLINLFADYNGIVGGEELLDASTELSRYFHGGMLSNLPTSVNLYMLAAKRSKVQC